MARTKAAADAPATPSADLIRFATGVSKLGIGTSFVGIVVAVVLGLHQLCVNRGTVRIVPLAATAGVEHVPAAMRFDDALAAIADGVSSGIDLDESIRRTTASPAVSVAIPGTTIPVEGLFEWLATTRMGAQDRVRFTVVSAADGTRHRLQIQVDGWHVPTSTFTTDEQPSLDAAVVDGAERVFALLRPVGAAYYFATRDPERSLAILAAVQRREGTSADEQATVHRVLAVILRDQGDHEAARERLLAALAATRHAGRRARLHLDVGDTYALAGRWAEAADAFREALALAPGHPTARVRLGEALVALDRLDVAEGAFEYARVLDPHEAAPWLGLGDLARRRGDVWVARDRYRAGRRDAFSPHGRAALDRALADLYLGLGCVAEARGLYRQAGALVGCYGGPGAAASCPGVPWDANGVPCMLLAVAPPPRATPPRAS